MALKAVKHIFNGTTTPITSYDSTKTNLGTLMIQKSGTNPEDNFVGPIPVAVARPMEESTPIAMMFPHAITFNSTIDWVFLVESAAAAAKRVFLYEYNKVLGTYNWKGFITTTMPAATNVTRGFRVIRYLYTTGTVAVAAPTSVYSTGTAALAVTGVVTGTGTTFASSHIGMMIGFGSTTPASINCWYPITTFTSTTSITVFGASNAIAATSYVIASCTVTGTGTAFATEGVSAGTASTGVAGGLGPRIGFGSTDPTQIANWYHIGFVTSDTSLNINTSPGVIPSGTAYVIEELNFALALTNTTVANGGLFVVKGVGYHDFTTAGTTLPSIASSVDNQRGTYWLADMPTVTNTASCGCAIGEEVSKGLHYAYVLDGVGATYMKVYRYNLRATGTVSSGKMTLSVAYTTAGTVGVSGTAVTGSGTSFTAAMVGMKIGFGSTSPALITTWYTISAYSSGTSITLSSSAGTIGSGASYIIDSADVVCTGNQLVTGTVIASNNGRIGTLSHGPGKDEESLYFVTASRIYRAAVSKIFAGNLGWISDNRPEIPPGSINTVPATAALNCVEIADAIDRLIVMTTGATAFRSYVTRYPAVSGEQFDFFFGVDSKQQDQSSADTNTGVYYNTCSQATSVWSQNGIAHIIKHGTLATLNQMYALPLSAHNSFASSTNQRVITPSLSTPDCLSFDRLLITEVSSIGKGQFKVPTSSIIPYYRTNGITDNTGEWTLVPADGDLTGVASAQNIQFMFEFETISLTCVPGRLISIALLYEDYTTDSHYQPSSTLTVATSKQFAWRFSSAFSGTVPTLRIRIFDAVTGGLIVDDDSATPEGTWEKSTNSGGAWSAYDTSDKANETTYIRYTPASLPDNIKVRALLTQY